MARRDAPPPFGSKATPKELAKLARVLSRWRSPGGFRRILRRFERHHHDYGLDQPGSCYRDAATALMFADVLPASAVRLGADPPDFELVHQGATISCEAVEVLKPGRRRGDELKHDRRMTDAERLRPQLLGEGAWTDTETVLAHLAATVARKAAKPYAAGTVLCIYLNPGFVTDKAALAAGLAPAVQGGFPRFAAVWLIHGGALSRFAAAPSAPNDRQVTRLVAGEVAHRAIAGDNRNPPNPRSRN